MDETNIVNMTTIPAHIVEEFCREGKMDYAYFISKYNVRMTQKEFKEIFSNKKLDSRPKESEITKEEFQSLYEFGKFNSVRCWVGEVHNQTGKFITQQDVFNWVLETK